MGAIEVTQEMLAAKFGAIFLHLDERQRRLLMGAEARALGHGGIRLVARAAIVCHKPRSCRPPARTPRSDTPRGKDQLWLSGIAPGPDCFRFLFTHGSRPLVSVGHEGGGLFTGFMPPGGGRLMSWCCGAG